MEPIAEAVGVSNTPVREGLLLLRSEGFVRLVPRRGFVVAPFTPQDVRDIFWAQAKLGGELAWRAAKNRTEEQLRQLEANLAEYEKAIAAVDNERIAELGHQFHRGINLAADSNRLALLLGAMVKHLPNTFYAAIAGYVEGAHIEHPMILDALRKRQSRKARSVMEQHVLEGADRLIEALEKQGLWTDLE
jgi:DNA-binding GntR family transcriptional regulator